jgi:hypothetical protein
MPKGYQQNHFPLEKVSILEVDPTVRKLFFDWQELTSPKSGSLLFNSLQLALR